MLSLPRVPERAVLTAREEGTAGDLSNRLYRALNLLYYVSPGWRLENGGNLELWDEHVTTPMTVESRFNRSS